MSGKKSKKPDAIAAVAPIRAYRGLTFPRSAFSPDTELLICDIPGIPKFCGTELKMFPTGEFVLGGCVGIVVGCGGTMVGVEEGVGLGLGEGLTVGVAVGVGVGLGVIVGLVVGVGEGVGVGESVGEGVINGGKLSA